MRKILMISYFYPPVNNIAAQRSVGFSKYLPKFGWEPIVLSRNWAGHSEPLPCGVKVIQTQYRDKLFLFRKGLFTCTRNGRDAGDEDNWTDKNRSGFFKKLKNKLYLYAHEVLDYPDEYTGWIPYALAAGRRIIQEENISVILSTFSPATSHIIAYRLKQEFNLPWVADFRDLWAQNPYHEFVHTRVRKFFDKRLEKKIIKTADLIITTTEPFAKQLNKLHNKVAAVITNGFDSDSYPTQPIPQNNCFTVIFAGNLYGGKRNPLPLFLAVRELIDEKIIQQSDFEIRFYGSEEGIIKKLASASNILKVVKCYDKISHKESLLKQQESTVLLLLRWDSAGEKMFIAGKLFEYLGARRPILAIPGNDGVAVDLIKETNAGVAAGTKEEVKHHLKKWYLEFKEKGYLPYYGKEEIIMRYTREKQTEQLASFLDHIYSSK